MPESTRKNHASPLERSAEGFFFESLESPAYTWHTLPGASPSQRDIQNLAQVWCCKIRHHPCTFGKQLTRFGGFLRTFLLFLVTWFYNMRKTGLMLGQVVVSGISNVHPYVGRWSKLTNISLFKRVGTTNYRYLVYRHSTESTDGMEFLHVGISGQLDGLVISRYTNPPVFCILLTHGVVRFMPPRITFYQWSFLVPLLGGRQHIIPQLAVYTIYIPLIYCLLGDDISPTTY